MITTTSLYDQLISFYNNTAGSGQQWLSDLRSRAFEAFSAQGFPTTKNEEWRFTNIAAFLKEALR